MIYKAYAYLIELVDEGYEFSVAHEYAINKFKLSYQDGKKLIEWYDEDLQ